MVEDQGERYAHQPIEIVGKEFGGKTLIDGNRLSADQEWVKNLTLLVKNVSDKNIISFDIHLLIKRDGLVVLGFPIYFRTFTKPTSLNALGSDGTMKFGAMRPGEVVKVRVSDNAFTKFHKAMVDRGINDPDRVTIDIRAVYFDDGVRWMFGQSSRPDPNNPEKRIRLEKP